MKIVKEFAYVFAYIFSGVEYLGNLIVVQHQVKITLAITSFLTLKKSADSSSSPKQKQSDRLKHF